MKKHSIYLFLLGTISLNAQAVEVDREFASDRFASCFVNESSESLCWQQMLTQPNPAVHYDFGVHYANGDEVKQDLIKGRYWIHHAALNGFPLAQYNLGVMFFDGLGGTQSKECAVHWLNKSSSESDETREMAQQALAALSELTLSAGSPKVYRILTEKECEQLPEIAFPGGEVEPLQPEETSDSSPGTDEMEPSQDAPVTFSPGADALAANLPAEPLQPEETAENSPDTDEMEPLQDAPVTFSPGADTLAVNLPAEPNQAVQLLPIEPEAKSSPVTIFRQKMGQYFIQLGHQLLGQEGNSEQDTAHHDVDDKSRLNHPYPVVYPDGGTVIETVSVEPESVVAETVVSAPTEAVLSADESLFAEPVLDHPVDMGAICPDEIDVAIPLETPTAEVAELIVKPSETEASDVALSSSANEAGELPPAEKEEITLPASIPTRVPESTEAITPAVPDIAPRVVEKVVPQRLNLGGALRSAPKEHYTLQLGSASQAEPLQALAKKYKLSNYLVYETQRHGRRWYVLVYGEYAGMMQAKQALQQLPGTLKKDAPWIRSLAHVHSEL